MSSFDPSSLSEVRYYTEMDPYYYTVDNRPLYDLDQNIQTVAGEISAISEQVDSATNLVTNAVTQVAEAVTKVSTVTGQISEIEDQLASVDGQISTIDGQLDTVNDQITGIGVQIDNVPHMFEDDTGASKVGWLQPVAGAISRTVAQKLSDNLNIKDFGAIGDGVADDRAAITAMASAKGYVVYPVGLFRITSSYTIGVPQFFCEGAALTVDAAATLTINNRINSSNQWIFQGTGPVLIRLTDTGEDAQLVRGGWFGVFPSNQLAIDVTARLQRALSSLSSQTREGTVQVEIGSFHISGTITVPRGVQLSGRGIRRTIFDISGAPDYPIFQTGGNACKFTDFQFEYPTGQAKVRTAPYIWVLHNTCDIKRIWLYPTTIGIIVDSSQCYIEDVRATIGLDPKAVDPNSSIIWIRQGTNTVNGVRILNTTYFPNSIVRVGYNATISNVSVKDIQTSTGCTSVLVDARACTVTRCSINDILSNPSGVAADSFDSVVKVISAGAFLAQYLTINNVVCTSAASSAVHLEASETSIIEHIAMGAISAQSSATGDGVRLLNNGTGSIRDIYCGNDVDVSARATPLRVVGTVSRIFPSPSMRGTSFSTPVVSSVTIAPGSVAEIGDFRSSIFAGQLSFGSATSDTFGAFSFRSTGTGSDHMTKMYGSAIVVGVTTDLTGTTGTSGNVTVGLRSSGRLVIENRRATSVTIAYTLAAGY